MDALLICVCKSCVDVLISNIDTLINLEILICNNSSITKIGLLHKLKCLICNDTNITDISHLTSLVEIICNNTKIKDINNLSKLIVAEIKGTEIKDISKLVNLKSLTSDDASLCYNSISRLMENVHVVKDYKIKLPEHMDVYAKIYSLINYGDIVN